MNMPGQKLTLTASDFKARCLAILDQLARGETNQVTITKRGKIVGVLRPPALVPTNAYEALFGCMEGSVVIPEGFDLTAPSLDEPFSTISWDKLHE